MATEPARSRTPVGRYRPILELGQGGMAEVVLAVGRGPGGFNKLVVLKHLRRELAGDPDMRSMFLGEARISARLNHANVVQVYEVADVTQPCMVMEYLDGQPMSEVLGLGEARFTPTMQLRVLSQVLSGLHYSHELCDYDGTPLNLVHRDVSPQNIIITYEGQVKVLDFGIAKVTGNPHITQTGVVKGKLGYMPPEQLVGEAVDRRADVYAVGCLLWHAAAGTKLWHGMREAEIMRRLLDGALPAPSTVRQVSPELERIVMKALAPDPRDRYATALELQEAIDLYLGEAAVTNTMRDVGALVAREFAHRRDELAKTIHAALSAPPSLRPAATEGAAPSVRPGDRPRWASWLWPGVAALALILVAVTGIVSMTHSGGLSARDESTPAPDRAPVRVRISVLPRGAKIWVDGKPLEDNPAVLEVVPDDEKHEIRAALAGHVPIARTVRFDRNVALELSLEPGPVAPDTVPLSSAPGDPSGPVQAQSLPSWRRPPVKQPPSRPSATAPPPQPPPPDDSPCNPPFYLENGVKVFKRECL